MGDAREADPGPQRGLSGGVGQERRGPVPGWLGVLAEPIYRAAISRRNAAFDAGRGVTKLDVPVISVGNLSVGGTGKTPMVMHIVGLLLRAGRKPCIAMRGYAGAGRVGGRRGGDEADAYQRVFGGGVPIVAQPDRIAGLREVMGNREAIDCVVLDDGFQHRKIARDLDIVLVDATRPPSGDRLLPAGWLREPVRSLRRASAVVITHAECASAGELSALKTFVGKEHGRGVLAVTRHLWTGLASSRMGEEVVLPLDALAGRKMFACCAIGNPAAFVRTLEMTATGVGGRVAGRMVLKDHDPFAAGTVGRLKEEARRAGADAIVVTDKDWSKLRWAEMPIEVLRPVLTMAFDEGAEGLERAVLGVAGGWGK